MTEAIICSMKYVYDHLEIDNIVYTYAKDNYKSKGLSDKIGFDFDCEFDEYYVGIDKNIKSVRTIMSKEKFEQIYGT